MDIKAFISSVSWSEKTTYFYPPWKYLNNIENSRLEGLQEFSKHIGISSSKLNLYLHFPLCETKCPFCFYFSSCPSSLQIEEPAASKAFKKKYHELLCKEVSLWIDKIRNPQNKGQSNIEINSIYFGGGTPSFWFGDVGTLNHLIDSLASVLNANWIDSLAEVTFEINPRSWNYGVINRLFSLFDRKLKISIGAQSFSDKSLKQIRNMKEGQIGYYKKNITRLIKKVQEKNIFYNIDFMWGLKDSPISTELDLIQQSISEYYKIIPQYTFYHIWSPNNLKKEEDYIKAIELDNKEIVSQRKLLNTKLSQWGYEPSIYIEYFKNKKIAVSNNYNEDEMQDQNYLGCGLSAHGKVGNILYLNKTDYQLYQTRLEDDCLPIEKYHFIEQDTDKKRKFVLRLRLPSSVFRRGQLQEYFSDEDIANYFFKSPGEGYSLNEKGILNLPELLLETQIKEMVCRESWQKKEIYDICEKIENFLELKEIRVEELQDILDILAFDLFKLINIVANFKIVVCNSAYYSPIHEESLFGAPWGISKQDWDKAYNEWDSLDEDNKISLYSLFFGEIHQIGTPFPLRLSNDILEKHDNDFLCNLEHILTTNASLKKKFSKIRNRKYRGITEFKNLLQLFFKDGAVFIYFVGVRTSMEFAGNGGTIISTESELNEEEIYKIGALLEDIYSFIVQKEYSQKLLRQNISSAGTAILVESYAHNIGAHGLPGLKDYLQKEWNTIKQDNDIKSQTLMYARTFLNQIYPAIKQLISTHSQFPEYVMYLQGKSAFWNAISRGGELYGGEISNLWDIIDEFAGNNLLCGSLGASEEYDGVEFHISYSKNGEIQKNENIGISRLNDDDIYRFEKESINQDLIDKYAERLGKSKESVFSNAKQSEGLKLLLAKEEIFLPEGIVAQQAIYTIWENIIRNVKHCKKTDDYIPFNIDIENQDPDFYSMTCWLDLNSSEDNLASKASEMNNWRGVLKEDNKPNMGGTSQNILCAGLIKGINFLESGAQQTSQESTSKLMTFEAKTKNGRTRLLTTFRIWKGQNDCSWEQIKHKEGKSGPSSRFKLVKVNEGHEEEFLSTSSSIRYQIVKSDDNRSFNELYRDWVKDKILSFHKEGVYIMHDYFPNRAKPRHYSKDEWNVMWNSTNKIINFYHNSSITVLSPEHINIPFKKSGVMAKIINSKGEVNLFEFVEMVATQMDIFDNRIFRILSHIQKESEIDQNTKLNDLGVWVFKEDQEKVSQVAEAKKHFLIIHLSFLEKITGLRNAQAIEAFWKQNESLIVKYGFVIITTGRARDCRSDLAENKIISTKIRFIPIENLEKCFIMGEQIEPLCPALGIKYALTKSIFGS